MVDPPLVLTPGEVAEMLRLSDAKVRRLVRAGYLRSLPGVRHLLIPRWSVDLYLHGEYDDCSDGTRPERVVRVCGPPDATPGHP